MYGLDCKTYNVVICDCGSTGPLLSAYLGQINAHDGFLERGTEVKTDPLDT